MAAAETFQNYIDESFPVRAKKTRSAIIRRNYAERIMSFLKDGRDEMDKNFRHMVKKKADFSCLIYQKQVSGMYW